MKVEVGLDLSSLASSLVPEPPPSSWRMCL